MDAVLPWTTNWLVKCHNSKTQATAGLGLRIIPALVSFWAKYLGFSVSRLWLTDEAVHERPRKVLGRFHGFEKHALGFQSCSESFGIPWVIERLVEKV